MIGAEGQRVPTASLGDHGVAGQEKASRREDEIIRVQVSGFGGTGLNDILRAKGITQYKAGYLPLCVPKIGFGVDAGNKRGKLAA